MHEIILHGGLKKRYGESFFMDVATPAEVIRALCSQLEGIEQDIREGVFRLVRGDIKKGTELGEEDLFFNLGKEKEFHIVPVPAGAKRGGIGKIILGVALIGVGLANPIALQGLSLAGTPLVTSIGGLGVSLALGGVSQLLSPSPRVQDYSSRERPDQRPSFLFNGAVNVAEQGLPIPLVYGQMRTGSVVVSAGITTDNI
jgi:predicted phage tail protein